MLRNLMYILTLFLIAPPTKAEEVSPRLKLVGEEKPLDFFQPSKRQIESWGEGIIYKSDLAEDDYYMINKFIVVDDVPYYRYWQLGRDDAYAFHPSALGAALSSLTTKQEKRPNKKHDQHLATVVKSVEKLAVELPNGGLTWYYPDVYPLNRMMGPKVQYSSLGQARLLAAAMKMARVDSDKYRDFLDRIAKGMEFNYRQGGVLWQDSVFLEFPLFFGPPEVILNGWIDSLLNYSDYVAEYPNAHNQIILEKNMTKLAEMLPDFDDKKHALSLYSNTTPLRYYIKKSSKSQDFNVRFRSRDPLFSDYEIELGRITPVLINGKEYRSPYDTQIFHDNGSTITALIACNKKYPMWVESDKPFTLSVKTGTYVKTRATPGAGGEKVFVDAKKQENGIYTANLDKKYEELFCGYPTNFGKNGGKNLYHAYHVVGLLYLAKSLQLNKEERNRLIQYAHLWMDYIEQHKKKGNSFVPYLRILNSINAHKFNKSITSWDELLAWSKEQS